MSVDTSDYIPIAIDLRGGPLDGFRIDGGARRVFQYGYPFELHMWAHPAPNKKYPHLSWFYRRLQLVNGEWAYRFDRYEVVE